MFPLKRREIGGYRFGQKTFYNSFHKGTDYKANYEPLYAAFDGMVSSGFTEGGGNFVTLVRPNGDTLTSRHLSKILKRGQVKEGEQIAVTGGRKGDPTAGEYSDAPHLHQEVKIDGKLIDPEKYNWDSLQYPMQLNVQLVFTQKYTNELAALTDAKQRMEYLSGGKVTFNYLLPIYAAFQNIPSKVFMDTSGEDMAVDKDWFIDNVWSLNKTADIVVLVGKQGDWQNTHNNATTYGHYYSELPATFPVLIQIVAGENDRSWKWPQIPAFSHYLTHEVSHPLQQMTGPDRTHEFDYATSDGLTQVLPYLDYYKIKYQLTHKISYERNASVFIKKENDSTIYLNEGDVLVPFAASYESFLADFPSAKVVQLSPNEFLKLRIANRVVIKDR